MYHFHADLPTAVIFIDDVCIPSMVINHYTKKEKKEKLVWYKSEIIKKQNNVHTMLQLIANIWGKWNLTIKCKYYSYSTFSKALRAANWQ